MTTARTATLTIGGQAFTVTQDAVSCTCSLSGTVVRVGPAAASTSLDVTTPVGCGWAAASKVSWVTVTPGNGNGAMKVTIAVAANDTTAARTGNLTIAGTTVTVNQDVKPRPSAPKGIKVLPGKKK
jgi:hypothetical protein